ncbi:hypothetical protein T4E_6139 [Trichinella pseudospiralis]|uniref:Uncharacterized protein n=1 Tax=Trichinella pseudospiralis TaxID=6337 RepID=A0A0V0Y6W5_TRIPS|nr:hypothetical protein T4E_6139 [Trichinella pseudospiralis]
MELQHVQTVAMQSLELYEAGHSIMVFQTGLLSAFSEYLLWTRLQPKRLPLPQTVPPIFIYFEIPFYFS